MGYNNRVLPTRVGQTDFPRGRPAKKSSRRRVWDASRESVEADSHMDAMIKALPYVQFRLLRCIHKGNPTHLLSMHRGRCYVSAAAPMSEKGTGCVVASIRAERDVSNQ